MQTGCFDETMRVVNLLGMQTMKPKDMDGHRYNHKTTAAQAGLMGELK